MSGENEVTEMEEDQLTAAPSAGGSPPAYTRLKYAWYILAAFLLCLLFKDGMWGAIHSIPFLRQGCNIPSEVPGHETIMNVCLGHTLVYRVSFSLFLFFAIHYVLASDLTCCLETDTRVVVQTKFFCVKTSLLSLLFFVTVFIDNRVFEIWAEICIGGSALFLLIQVVLLVDFGYTWNEKWAMKESKKWMYYLLACTGGMYIAALVLVILMFVWFVPSAQCSLNSAAVTITLLAGLFTTAVSIYVPHGSLLPTSMIFLYNGVQCFSALQSGSLGPECNALYTPTQDTGLSKSMIFSALFTGITLMYTALSAGGSRRAFSMNMERNPDDDDFSDHGYCFFHGVMMLASMYLAMVLTSWGDDRGMGRIDNSEASMWVKLCTEWITMGVYLWSLLAPYYCCKDRDFGIEV
eukprot:PhF_6_TR7326/c0_g1_i1/m.10998